MSNETVRFFNAAFDERDGDILLRGSIDPESLQKLHVDDYQREILPRKGSLTYWTEQLRRGFIPRHRRRHEGRCVFSRTGSTAWFFPVGVRLRLETRSSRLVRRARTTKLEWEGSQTRRNRIQALYQKAAPKVTATVGGEVADTSRQK